MTDMSFSAVLQAMSQEGAVYSAPVPPNWTQGRTAYGGFTSTLLLAAARRAYPDLPPLRSVLVNFTGPLGAPPDIRVELLRQGRNITTLLVRAETDGKPVAVGTFSFGVAQDSHVAQALAAPSDEGPEAFEPFFPPQMTRVPARFFENFEVKLIDGHRPFAGADRGYVRVWARHRDPGMWASPEGLLSIADMLPPAVFAKCSKIGPNSSVNWICNVLSEDMQTEDGWWMIESDLSAGHDGYSSQVMRMWNSKGELVVDGMQSVVIFV
jgi:acyl-CoA thioesterase